MKPGGWLLLRLSLLAAGLLASPGAAFVQR
jgi:hypothetical protein